MWRVLNQPISENLRAELEARVVAAIGTTTRLAGDQPELLLKDFFIESRGAGQLLRELLDTPDARALIAQRLTDPVILAAYPEIKLSGAPATRYRREGDGNGGSAPVASAFTLWIALGPTNGGNGCLRMASTTGESDNTVVALARPSHVEIAPTSAPAYDVAMKPGEIVFFDADQLHGAYPNHSGEPRLAVRVTLAERSGLAPGTFQEIAAYGSLGLAARQGWRKLLGREAK